ncbi:MAG: TIGR02302 family protein [Amaricoccus sp.]|uniref:TIGR02302 family protein n=1 Tax=Amaricoccus sp. TaxID=1872485 RepID=UPI0039E385B4
MSAKRPADRGGDALARVVLRSRLAMGLESLARAFWPFLSAAGLAWAAFAFGLAEILTRPQVAAVASVVALLLLALLGLGARRFRWPTADAARERLDATLPGRPLASLRDVPALGAGDPGAQSVWAAHIARMRRAAARARPLVPDLRLARFDPWAIRLGALVAVVAALAFAPDRRVESVVAALGNVGGPAAATGPSFEGWAEPPAYTGRPTLYLSEVAGTAPVSVPQGTRVTVRAYGDSRSFALTEDVSAAPATLAEAAPGIQSAEFEVTKSGSVSLDDSRHALGAWSFAMEPDVAPTIALTGGGLERGPNGETSLAYTARDDHGITAARAEIALDLSRVTRTFGLAVDPEARPPLVADLPLPMTGGSADLSETLVEDFSKSPFAGLPVTVRLTAEDAIGQTGQSPAVATVLPMRSFYDPLAMALIEQRRDLLWSAANAPRVAQVLRAVTWQPDDVFESPRTYLVVRTAIRRLAAADAAGSVPQVRDEVAEALWKAAVEIEDGRLGDAKDRLAKARQRLEQALENGADDQEVARLMDELRQATRDYMQQMARDAIQRGDQQQAQIPPGQTMTQDQIQQLMDRIQELSEQGKKAEAQQLLDMLQQMLENMQMQMGQGEGQPGQQGQGQQSMQGLSDALREQQGLADDSFQQLQRQFNQGSPGQQGQPGGGEQGRGEQGQERPGQGGADSRSLAERQEALRGLMEQLKRDLPGGSSDATRQALENAERSMGEARDGLEKGDVPGALDKQSDAIDSLHEGIRQMGDDMRRAGRDQAPGEGEQGQAAGESTAEGGRDPLGRPVGSRGGIGTGQNMLPEADSIGRARQLLDEIRRRSGDMQRPEIELDYLRRLLDMF